MPAPDLHIVSFAVPYPAIYGGAIDAFNRIKALKEEGVKINLHCFVYGSFSPHDALRELTADVNYYPRITWPALLSPGTPYIVASRRNPKLLDRLNEDNAPVLFEGIHATGFIDDLQKRKKLLRSHNIEHQYYGELARDSQRFQYLFFQRESLALERYEIKQACAFDCVFAISPKDQQWYEKQGAKSEFMPVYHGLETPSIKQGRGSYLLYQGDLSIESNQRAIIEFLKAPGVEHYPVVIAGRTGERSFEEKLTKYPNVRREVDVSEDKMTNLIRDAQVVVIHSRHSAGMKVKIFTAIFNGRFIIANENSLTGTNLDKAMYVYRSSDQLPPLLDTLWQLEFTNEHLRDRNEALKGIPGGREMAKTIVGYL